VNDAADEGSISGGTATVSVALSGVGGLDLRKSGRERL
jgi:hypothetical protein